MPGMAIVFAPRRMRSVGGIRNVPSLESAALARFVATSSEEPLAGGGAGVAVQQPTSTIVAIAIRRICGSYANRQYSRALMAVAAILCVDGQLDIHDSAGAALVAAIERRRDV